jgi:Holliday junction resolvasome RuvABC DNA-binding subunit
MATNEKGSRGTIRSVLTLKETLLLCDCIKAHYVELNKNNQEFAEFATEQLKEKLRFPLNHSHIVSALVALGIPNNQTRRVVARVEDSYGLAVRVQALEDQLARLTKFVREQSPWKTV